VAKRSVKHQLEEVRLGRRPVSNELGDLILHVTRNHRAGAEYPDTGGGFRSRLQPHSADVAVAQRDAHVSHPPRGSLHWLALGATKQVGVGIDPDVPAQQILVYAPGKRLENVTALAAYLFLADEAEIIIVPFRSR